MTEQGRPFKARRLTTRRVAPVPRPISRLVGPEVNVPATFSMLSTALVALISRHLSLDEHLRFALTCRRIAIVARMPAAHPHTLVVPVQTVHRFHGLDDGTDTVFFEEVLRYRPAELVVPPRDPVEPFALTQLWQMDGLRALTCSFDYHRRKSKRRLYDLRFPSLTRLHASGLPLDGDGLDTPLFNTPNLVDLALSLENLETLGVLPTTLRKLRIRMVGDGEPFGGVGDDGTFFIRMSRFPNLLELDCADRNVRLQDLQELAHRTPMLRSLSMYGMRMLDHMPLTGLTRLEGRCVDGVLMKSAAIHSMQSLTIRFYRHSFADGLGLLRCTALSHLRVCGGITDNVFVTLQHLAETSKSLTSLDVTNDSYTSRLADPTHHPRRLLAVCRARGIHLRNPPAKHSRGRSWQYLPRAERWAEALTRGWDDPEETEEEKEEEEEEHEGEDQHRTTKREEHDSYSNSTDMAEDQHYPPYTRRCGELIVDVAHLFSSFSHRLFRAAPFPPPPSPLSQLTNYFWRVPPPPCALRRARMTRASIPIPARTTIFNADALVSIMLGFLGIVEFTQFSTIGVNKCFRRCARSSEFRRSLYFRMVRTAPTGLFTIASLSNSAPVPQHPFGLVRLVLDRCRRDIRNVTIVGCGEAVLDIIEFLRVMEPPQMESLVLREHDTWYREEPRATMRDLCGLYDRLLAIAEFSSMRLIDVGWIPNPVREEVVDGKTVRVPTGGAGEISADRICTGSHYRTFERSRLLVFQLATGATNRSNCLIHPGGCWLYTCSTCEATGGSLMHGPTNPCEENNCCNIGEMPVDHDKARLPGDLAFSRCYACYRCICSKCARICPCGSENNIDHVPWCRYHELCTDCDGKFDKSWFELRAADARERQLHIDDRYERSLAFPSGSLTLRDHASICAQEKGLSGLIDEEEHEDGEEEA